MRWIGEPSGAGSLPPAPPLGAPESQSFELLEFCGIGNWNLYGGKVTIGCPELHHVAQIDHHSSGDGRGRVPFPVRQNLIEIQLKKQIQKLKSSIFNQISINKIIQIH